MNETGGVLHRALLKLLTEIFDGPKADEAYILNPGDIGLLRQLESVTAGQASTPSVPGGSTIAAHTDHVLYGITLLNRHANGEANPWQDADWNASWKRTVVSEAQWRALRDTLKTESAAWQKAAAAAAAADEVDAAGLLSSLGHTAYHLGAIRQIIRTVS